MDNKVTVLLNDPAVEECFIHERNTQKGVIEKIAYVVVPEPYKFEQIEPRLKGLTAHDISAFVPIAYLPLDEKGEIDIAALEAIPVLVDEVATEFGSRIEALPHIERAVCLSGYWSETPERLHIGKLLTNPLQIAGNALPQSDELAEPVRDVSSAPAAIYHGEALSVPPGSAQVLQQVLCSASAHTPIIYIDGNGNERVESYGSLLAEARRILNGLQQEGLQPGDKVIFQLEQNDDILPSFWGCLLGGFEPVIVPVPLSYDVESRALEQLRHIWILFEQPLIVTNKTLGAAIVASSHVSAFSRARLANIETLRDHPETDYCHAASPDDIAFYTLSSGSTGIPKAVTLTHRSLLARARGANSLCQHSSDDVILNWLPFDHIGSISEWHIRYLDLGCKLVYAPKEYILARALRWLDLINHYRAAHSWAPNFAYALVVSALKSEQPRNWDLSCVKSLLTAGEAITRTTTREFVESLEPYGLQSETLLAAFGMAEVCSGITYHQPVLGQSLKFYHLDRNYLTGAISVVDADDERCISFASLGPVIPGVSMRIVNDEQQVLPEYSIGHLQLKGEPLTSGYYHNPEANRALLADGWFETGDAGFIVDGELVLTGRAGAGIIINGANFYNNEIEAVVEQIPGVAASFTAACAVRHRGDQTLKLAVFFHADYENNDQVLLKLLKSIQSQLTKRLGIKADYLLPLDANAIPKTGIGKIQHKVLIKQFQQGDFHEILERLDLLTANEQTTLPDQFYKKVWRRKQALSTTPARQGNAIIFLDALGLGQQVAAALAQTGVRCILVKPGADFVAIDAQTFSLCPSQPQHYSQLVEQLQIAAVKPDFVLHLFNYTAGQTGNDAVDLQQGAYSVLSLIQALSAFNFDSSLRLLAVSSYSQAVNEHDSVIGSKATLSGLLHGLNQEVPWLQGLHLDCPVDAVATYVPAIVEDLLGSSSVDKDIAYRGQLRWVAGLKRVDTAEAAQQSSAELPFKQQAVYIIKGGLEGLGAQLAEYLLSRFNARLLLLGRTALEADTQNEQAASRLALYQRLQQLPGECVYLAVDLLDTAQLLQELTAPLAAWGNRLDGIIHFATVTAECPLLDETLETLDAKLAPELTGADALYQILQQYQGQLFVSLSATVDFSATVNCGALAISSAFNDVLSLQLIRNATQADIRAISVADITVQGSINAVLLALLLNEKQVSFGLDNNSQAVRALTHDGAPQLSRTTVYFTARKLISPEMFNSELQTDRYGSTVVCDYKQLREPESATAEQVELWPSVAEYFVYDDLIYYALANDERRNQSYRVALKRTVPGKIVLDIGTGKEAILARLALEAGASKVYAIEMGDEAFAQAVAYIQALGLDDKIIIIHGDATKVDIPELADVCVSEIVGPIGGCEGATALINNAHRFLRPGGIMIPGRSTTKIAAARFPDELLPYPGFYQVPGSYTSKIFAEVGYSFDLRLCIKNFPRKNLLSNADIFEDLDFNSITPLEEQHDIDLLINQESRFDGFLVWLNLHTIEGEVIDIIEHEYSWLPVYLPVFYPGIDAKPGDRVQATVARTLCANGLNPDFVVSGHYIRANGESIPFTCTSCHFLNRYKQHPFYELLFAEDPLGRHPGNRPGNLLQHLPEMPLNVDGSVDRNKLLKQALGNAQELSPQQTPSSEIEVQIAKIWQDVLDIPRVGIHDNFFELGGHSLLLVQAHDRLVQIFGNQITLVDLFKYPTIKALVELLADEGVRETPSQKGQERAESRSQSASQRSTDIAVIGMACRFPGADDLETFWHNLSEGIESITFFDEHEITNTGIKPDVVRHPDYVKASPLLSDVEGFDAGFFGYSARDAELMDPQHRLFLECAWETFENAGYDPISYEGSVGVYAGASMNTYLLNNVFPNRDTLDTQDDLDVATLDSMGGFLLMVANDKDYLTTRVSYKLNLTGPSVNVQTACSTGLVTVHMACQSLLNGEADMFLAGGAAVQVPQQSGHLFQTGMIVSPDGHCRSFDAKAQGTVFGSGVGAVLLKRLDDAQRDGDHIYAIVKGSAVNNDGGVKVGYMAPSSEGQAAVAAEAIAMAGVSPDTIGFVEAHGTGTEMGDPIEVNALSQAFRAQTEAKGFCAIGSVKTNVGHLQITSGTVGFIKTALALQHKLIPPTLHFTRANPAIDFENSPFYVNTHLAQWKTTGTPLRAGVNSLGIGGANAHVILEEAPELLPIVNELERDLHLLTLTARTEPALLEMAGRYAGFFANNPDASLADVCFTANTGRKLFEYALAVPAISSAQLCADLQNIADGKTVETVKQGKIDHQGQTRVAFLFTGQGSQYPQMGRQLYDTQPVFRQQLDRCAEILRPLLDLPLLDVMYPADGSSAKLDETAYAQPALFALEYALAELWQSWGIEPAFVMGHSLGEYVAACVAGVFSLEEGLKLVTERARLMQALPTEGEMWAVFANADQLRPFLAAYTKDVAIAAENSLENTVISGRKAAITEIIASLQQSGYKTQQLNTSHAFHSPLMEPMLTEFASVAGRIEFAVPRIPLISNLTGVPASVEITSADYWCKHIRQPVKFMAGLQALSQQEGCEIFLEIGAKPVLSGMGQHGLADTAALWLPSLRSSESNWHTLLDSLSHLAVRRPVNWKGFDQGYQRRRLPLPTYPFQHQRYWLDRPPVVVHAAHGKVDNRSLIGSKRVLPTLQATVYENHFSVAALPFLQHHRIYDEVVVSGACYVAMLLAAGAQAFAGAVYTLKDVYFPAPLVIPKGQMRTVQMVLTPTVDNKNAVQLVSFVEDASVNQGNVAVHAEGLFESAATVPAPVKSLQLLWDRCTETIATDSFFAAQAERRIHLGPSYRWIEALKRGNRETICLLRKPADLGGLDAELLHPGLLDACFGLLLATGILPEGDTWLPFGIEEVRAFQAVGNAPLWAHLVLRPADNSNRVLADAALCDASGQVLLEFIGLEARAASHAAIQRYLPNAVDELLYGSEWLPLDIKGTRLPVSGQWLVFADTQGIAEQLAQRLRNQGVRCVLVMPGSVYEVVANDHYVVNPASADDFIRLLAESTDVANGFSHIVSLWSDREASVENDSWLSETQVLACASALYLLQALVRTAWINTSRLWLVSRGGQSVGKETLPPQIQQAALWGVGFAAALEHPELTCSCVDLDPAETANHVDELLATIAAGDDESRIAWRQGTRYVARLTSQYAVAKIPQSSVRADGSYLITGGTGGLGLCTASWLVAQGARNLILTSRNKPSKEALESIAHLRSVGAQVLVVQVNVADSNALSEVFAEIKASLPELRGIIHCAGVIDDALLVDQTWERFNRVFAAKINGAWHLHQLSRDLPLDFFVLFSSAASVLGNQGQSNYAAGNAFLDALAHYRKYQGLPATSINWGPWDSVGIAASDSTIANHMALLGFAGIKPEIGILALEKILSSDATQISVIDWNWQTYLEQMNSPGNLLAELRKTAPVVATADTNAFSEVLQKLQQATAEQRQQIIQSLVIDTVQHTLGISDSAPLDVAKPLADQGLDSLMAVQMRNVLGKKLRQTLPVSLVFNYPTVNDIVGYIEELINKTFDVVDASAAISLAVYDELASISAHALLAELNDLLDEPDLQS